MTKPTFHFITLFPETIQVWMTTSILGRALKAELFDLKIYQLRDFSEDKHLSVDDAAYGGGGGMVLRIEPLVKAVETIRKEIGETPTKVIYFSPAGKTLNHALVKNYVLDSKIDHFIFVCGHYEGVDQRFVDHWVDEEISIGDFVLTGGELPALAMADAMVRHLEGSLGRDSAVDTESFALKAGSATLLEYPHYTRPSDFRGMGVPEILLSGNHPKIESWRLDQARQRTLQKRPDLLTPSL